MKPESQAFEIGKVIAASIEGVDLNTVQASKAASDALRDYAPGALANGLSNFWCGLGYHTLREVGQQDTLLGVSLRKAASDSSWNPLTVALGRMVQEAVDHTLRLEQDAGLKSAAVGGAIASRALTPLATKAVAFTPDLMKLILGGAVLTGGALGGLGYVLNRHSKDSDEDIETMKARIAYYNQLSGELQNRTKAASLLDPAAIAGGQLLRNFAAL
jgi:hypothetical protein